MADEIAPALNAVEWETMQRDRRKEVYDALGRVLHATADPRLMREDMRTFSERAVAVIATLNAMLHDDDPRKLAQADVDEVLGSADNSERGDPPDPDLMRLAAKLAALLPPAPPQLPTPRRPPWVMWPPRVD